MTTNQGKPLSTLEEAQQLINGDRQASYGSADESFTLIGGLWSAYTGVSLNSQDVANMMILLKVARTRWSYHRDSYVDVGGYAGLTEQLLPAQQAAAALKAQENGDEEAPESEDRSTQVNPPEG